MISINRTELSQALRRIMSVTHANRFDALVKLYKKGNKLALAVHDGQHPTLSMVTYIDALFEDDFKDLYLNARKFSAFVYAASHDIIIRVKKRASVNSGKNRVILTLGNPATFPEVFEPEESDLVTTIDHKKFAHILSLSSIPDPKEWDSVRNSVYLMFEPEHIKALATDTYRYAYAWQEHISKKNMHVLVRANSLTKLEESFWKGDLHIYATDTQRVFFAVDGSYIYTPMNTTKAGYPHEILIKGLADKLERGVLVDGMAIKDKLYACTTMVSSSEAKKYVPVEFVIANEQLTIFSEANDTGEMIWEVPVKKQFGDDITFRVSSTIVRHALSLIEKASNDGLSNISIFYGEKSGWIFITGDAQMRYAFARMVDE